MTTSHQKPEAIARGVRMLRTALGPAIARFLEDPAVVEVMLNPDGRIWIDRLSEGLSATAEALSPADGERIVRLVAHHVGAEIHARSPRVSAELPETGERFEGLLPPVVAAPAFAIRKPAVAVFTLDDYVAAGTMLADQAVTLREAVASRANILVAGGTSTGKTTLTNALLAEIAKTQDRVVIIEDTRELQCSTPNLVSMRTKEGVATLSDLVRSSLRLRPDRIPIGEVRGAEALDLLKAWGTGHPGGVGTIHAGTGIGALRRLEPRLGDQHLRVLTIIGFPTATTPGLLDDLNRLAFPYRWSTRAILLDKTDATKLLTKIRRQWFAKRKSIAAILKEVMTNEASALVDTDAANKAADADMALQELGQDVAGMAYVTATITAWDADPRVADEKLRLVEEVIQGRDFTAMIETVNAVDAWLGSLPGHAYANVRQPPVSTLNLAPMIPLSAVWAGPERNEHFGARPLLYGKTESSTPFRLSLHVGDVGHTLVVGPTGAGKSVLLALMALQFRRYERSQVFAFDFGGSIRAAALAMGGDWHDLGGGLTEGDEFSVSLQPLARIHDTYERAWAAGWIVAILMREGIPITPEVKEHIWTELTSLASAPVEERTITGLAVLLQSNDIKQALRPYCVGAYGRLLDAETEHLGSADVQAFEIEGLVGTGAAPAVLSYLFHRIGNRLDGRPTLLIIDEGWLALDDEGFASQLREWLKTLRKKNASVIFATQSLSDIDNSSIAPAIIESCPTRLLLPNERAIEPQITSIYRRFGLNDRQIEILARATPKRDYYCQSRRGNRLFELGLSEVGLALCAASSKSDQTLIANLVAEHGRERFLAAWLRSRDAAWAVDLLPTFPILHAQKETAP